MSEAAQTTPATEAVGTAPGKPGSRFRRIWLAALFLVVTILGVCLWPQKRDLRDSMVWLNPAEAGQNLQPDKWTRLKFNVLRKSKVLWSWYTKNQMQISLDSRFVTVPNGAFPLLTDLGSQCWTNENGMRARILSAEDWAYLKMRLPIGLQAAKATQTRMNPTIGNSTYYTVTHTSASDVGKPVSKVQAFAKVTGDHFNLVLMASTAEIITSSDGTYGGMQTNLALNCRVILPNGGAVVVAGRAAGDKSRTNFWFITSAEAVDSAGNAKKLEK